MSDKLNDILSNRPNVNDQLGIETRERLPPRRSSFA